MKRVFIRRALALALTPLLGIFAEQGYAQAQQSQSGTGAVASQQAPIAATPAFSMKRFAQHFAHVLGGAAAGVHNSLAANRGLAYANRGSNMSPTGYSSPAALNQGYAGNLSVNQFAQNRIDPYHNPYMNNQLTTDGPALIDSQGNYHGRLNGNRFDPDSVSNPFGRYGSKFSPDSENNQFGAGSQFVPDSPFNKFGSGMQVVNQ